MQSWFKTDNPPAQTTGLPPKVEPWSPGTKVVERFSLHKTAPIGSPAPSPFAQVTISGVILKLLYPNKLPVLAIPHWTSSNITNTSLSLANLQASKTKSLSKGWTPPSPWIAYIIIAQTSEVSFSFKSDIEFAIT